MQHGMIVLGCILASAPAFGDDVPAASALAQEQAQAREFGIFFGGAATQYDLCVKKGFLPKSERPAEETAKAIIEKMRKFTPGPDQSAFVQEGWDTMKVFVAQHASDYTQEKCAGVGKQWAKMLAMVPAK